MGMYQSKLFNDWKNSRIAFGQIEHLIHDVCLFVDLVVHHIVQIFASNYSINLIFRESIAPGKHGADWLLKALPWIPSHTPAKLF